MSWTFQCEPSESHFRFKVFNSIPELNVEKWNSIIEEKNLFLTTNYLSSLENSIDSSLNFKYVIFFGDDREPIGVAYLQIIEVSEVSSSEADAITKLANQIKSKLLGALDIRILVCGNIFANGENGFLFDDSVSKEVIYDNLSNVLFQIRQSQTESKQPSMVVLKEFWPESFESSDRLKDYEFRDFMVDVNMVLKIHTSWKSMDDYLTSMNTKFRTKAKSCFKKSKEIEIKELDSDDIADNIDRIEELYHNVVDHADFQFSKLNGKSFLQFKEQLENHYILNGYYLKSKLVGFSTSFINNDVLEAGYVGLDYEYNYKYAVYQKMLYNYVEQGIIFKANEVRLGRTAEEIKSTLGAEPVNMKLYARHRNSLHNKIIKPIIESITPSKFEVRKPFKSSFIGK